MVKAYLFVDAAYFKQKAVTVATTTHPQDTGKIISCYTSFRNGVARYEPGKFYKRELPCIMKVLGLVKEPLKTIFIDAHVWLSPAHPGLGAHLFNAIGKKIPVIGMAKKGFAMQEKTDEMLVKRVYRGKSKHPLHVTAAGIDLDQAAQVVQRLCGSFRIPYAMKKSHSLARCKLRQMVGLEVE